MAQEGRIVQAVVEGLEQQHRAATGSAQNYGVNGGADGGGNGGANGDGLDDARAPEVPVPEVLLPAVCFEINDQKEGEELIETNAENLKIPGARQTLGQFHQQRKRNTCDDVEHMHSETPAGSRSFFESLAKRVSHDTLTASTSLGARNSQISHTSMNRRRSQSRGDEPWSRCAQNVIQWRGFESVSAVVIVANAILVGIEADWVVTNNSVDVPLAFVVVDWTCNGLFTVELLLRILGNGRFYFSRLNTSLSWNIFDIIVVTLTYVNAFLYDMIFGSVQTDVVDNSSLRLLRIFRLVRVFRLLRVLRFSAVLRTMVQGIVNSFRSLMWALVLLAIIMYVVSVCLLQMIGQALATNEVSDANRAVLIKRYPDLINAVFTLYMSICGGIDWGDAAEPLAEVSGIMVPLFAAYVAFVVFCVLNIMTGIFVENANSIISKDEDRMVLEHAEKRKQWADSVKRLFCRFDDDKANQITFEQFAARLEDDKVVAYLEKLGLEVSTCNKRGLFSVLDVDGDGTLDPGEFAVTLQHLHGPARSLDLYQVKRNQKDMHANVIQLMKGIEEISSRMQYGMARPPPARACAKTGSMFQKKPELQNMNSRELPG
jgi:Ca2+-binding EF-hand superfamily protein